MNRYKLFKAGVDVNEALNRLGDDKTLYEELLLHFKNDNRYNDLVQALAENNSNQAFLMAHALKGTAGNLGFNRLFTALQPVVDFLRSGNLGEAKANFADVEASYSAIIEAI